MLWVARQDGEQKPRRRLSSSQVCASSGQSWRWRGPHCLKMRRRVCPAESEMSATDSDKDEGSLGGGSGTSSEEEAVVAKRRPVAGRRKAAGTAISS